MQDRQNLQFLLHPSPNPVIAIFQKNGPKYLDLPYQYTTLSVRKRISGLYCYCLICKCVVASESEITQGRGRTAILFLSAPPAAGASWGDWLAPLWCYCLPLRWRTAKQTIGKLPMAFLTVLPIGGCRLFLPLCTTDPLRKKILKAQHICSSVRSEGHMGFFFFFFDFLAYFQKRKLSLSKGKRPLSSMNHLAQASLKENKLLCQLVKGSGGGWWRNSKLSLLGRR